MRIGTDAYTYTPISNPNGVRKVSASEPTKDKEHREHQEGSKKKKDSSEFAEILRALLDSGEYEKGMLVDDRA